MRERLLADNLDSFVHVTSAPSITGTHPSGHQGMAVRSAAALQRLLDAGAYSQQTEPRLFVQRIEALGRVQHSVIGMIELDEHKLCAHEATHEANVVSLAASLAETAQMWSPVLATCPGAPWIRDVIDATIAANPVEPATSDSDLLLHAETADGATITLWCIDPASAEVSLADSIYIMDGHHRVAAGTLAGFKRVLVAMVPPEELVLTGFDRLISDIDVMPRRILEILAQFCEIAEVSDETAAIPDHAGWLGIGMGERWYSARRLDLLATNSGQNPASGSSPLMDSEFIHAQLLPALFDITEPSDSRITYRPSPLATGPFSSSGNSQPGSHANPGSDIFTVLSAPVPAQAVFAIADRGETMPPKSTYLVPKVRAGVMLVDY